MNLGSTTRARDQTTIHAVETLFFSPSKEGQGSVLGREGDPWPQSSGMSRALCSLTTFRKAKAERPRQLRKSKRPGKLTEGVLFHQDNAPAHKSVVEMAAMRDCGFDPDDHPSYSPDLALSIICSPTWKNNNTWLHGKQSDRWWSHICSSGLFEDQDESFNTTPRESKRCNTGGRSVWTAGETSYVEIWTMFGQIRPLHHSHTMNVSAQNTIRSENV